MIRWAKRRRPGTVCPSSAAGGLSRGSQPLGTGPQPVDDRVSDPAFFGIAIKYPDHLLVIIYLLFVERTPTSLVADHDPVAPCFEQLKLRSNFFDLPALGVEWLGRNGGAADRNQYSDTHNNCTRSKCFHGKTLLNSSHRPTCAFGEGRLEQRPDIQDSVKGCRAAPGKENSAGAMPLGDRDRHREKCGKGVKFSSARPD